MPDHKNHGGDPASAPRVVVGVDVGGTFTDTVVTFPGPDGRPLAAPVSAKVLTTPADPAVGVCEGVAEALAAASVAPGDVASVVHGTTLATNVILERAGVRVAFVATEGFGDLFLLGREARVEEDRYDLGFRPPPAPIAAGLVVEAPERTLADGRIRRPLTRDAARRVAARVAALRPDAVAVCLMHSWARTDHEDLLGEALREALPDTYLALSSRVWPEMREYERAMTTLLCAYVGPVMTGYLERLTTRLSDLGVTCGVRVMDSAGDIMPAAAAAGLPVRTVESGGAAGMAAAARVAREHTGGMAVSFDMGGTTAKAGIVRDGRPGITHDFQVGGKGSFGMPRAGTGLPVKGPVVDLSEVGAGGGSIAWVDDGGALRVGPRSAGADPGPACYGRGGTAATVTDANAVLGLFGSGRAATSGGGNADHDPAAGEVAHAAPIGGKLAGGVRLDLAAAEKAIRIGVAEPLGLNVEDAARAIREVAIARMATAIRLVTVQRGLDPRGFPMVAFGGAGAMHAADLAAQFGITEVVVPRGAGVMAAHGLASATAGVERVRTRPMALDAPGAAEAAGDVFADLVAAARGELAHDGPVVVRTAVDMRYVGQSHQLTVVLGATEEPPQPADLAARFRAAHQAAYGAAPDAPVELVTFRARVTADAETHATAANPSAEAPTAAAPSEVPSPAPPSEVPSIESPFAESAFAREAAPTGPPKSSSAPHVCHWDTLEHRRTPISGPAVVLGADATVVVPVGWTADATPGSHLTLRHAANRPAPHPSRASREAER
ncbi:hydantoinase/oxoprolinase family protein [Yinghuangia sp. YIM S09857]|uniref:hydantoinase/oxoprolinase family protein n=1 Tax=Yinghuangia sp. YIM S09857 TaxID=3436929 RepID=UPI003F53CE7B